MKELTLQQTYEKMRDYFSQPGATLARESKEEGATCCYLTDDGRKCAVGCLIPESMYRPYFEGLGALDFLNLLRRTGLKKATTEDWEDGGADVGELYDVVFDLEERENARRLYHLLDDDPQKAEFLNKAQALHDREATDAKDFVRQLRDMAERFGLRA